MLNVLCIFMLFHSMLCHVSWETFSVFKADFVCDSRTMKMSSRIQTSFFVSTVTIGHQIKVYRLGA